MSYYHKFYKYHYYTTDIEELNQIHVGKFGFGMWLYQGVIGYVLPNEVGTSTIPLHKYFNREKNKVFYTSNVEDISMVPATSIGHFSHSTDEFIKKELLSSGALEKNDEYVYLGLLGYILK